MSVYLILGSFVNARLARESFNPQELPRDSGQSVCPVNPAPLIVSVYALADLDFALLTCYDECPGITVRQHLMTCYLAFGR